MSADSNMSFHQGVLPSSFYDNHVVSFQSDAVNNTAAFIPFGMNSLDNMSGTSGLVATANPGMMTSTSGIIPARSSGNVLLDPSPSLKHDTGLAVDWSYEEQAILKEGLIKLSDQPAILKYIKIAAMLSNKTVRDVALRCRWMTKKESGKRRKHDEYFAGKKIKDRKEKLVESSLAMMRTVTPDCTATYPLIMHQMNQHNTFPYEVVPALDNATRNLLNENAQVLNRIAANLATFKLQDNIDLFCRTRNNIMAVLSSINGTSQMPPLPVALNENLMSVLLPDTSQVYIFGMPGSINLKQEPGC